MITLTDTNFLMQRFLLTAVAALSVLIVALCVVVSQTYAFGFSPFKTQLAPSGPAASQVFEIRNDEDYPQAIQVRVERWQQTVSGTEVNAPADDVLAVYPNQFVLKPRTSQSVRVRWTGSDAIKSEQAFRVVAEQLPVSLTAGNQVRKALRFLVTYRAALYVTPDDASADIGVTGLREETYKGQRFLAVKLQNQGNAHTLLKKPTFTLKAEGQDVFVDGTGVSGVDGENIHAGGQRELLLPWPAALKKLPQHATVNFEPDF